MLKRRNFVSVLLSLPLLFLGKTSKSEECLDNNDKETEYTNTTQLYLVQRTDTKEYVCNSYGYPDKNGVWKDFTLDIQEAVFALGIKRLGNITRDEKYLKGVLKKHRDKHLRILKLSKKISISDFEPI